MTLVIGIPDWSAETWWWIAFGLYMLFSYLVLGPWASRSCYKWEDYDDYSPGPVLIFIFSPISWAIYAIVYMFACPPWSRLIYGKHRPK